MDRPARVVEADAVEYLLKRLDNRIGNALFIGADLPEAAIHLLKRGLFVTVVESDARRLAAFMAPVREQKFDKQVSVDQRPYESIEFLLSSYNVIISWRGVPDGMPLPLFFKKLRKELKAGALAYLHLPVRPALPQPPEPPAWLEKVPPAIRERAEAAARRIPPVPPAVRQKAEAVARRIPPVPPAVRQKAEAVARRVAAALSMPGAYDMAEVKKAADQYLNVDSEYPLSVFAERLMLLPEAVRLFLKKAPLPTLEVARFLDAHLLKAAPSAAVASSVLIAFGKTKEFGHVFRV
jgi:hypothetical protein